MEKVTNIKATNHLKQMSQTRKAETDEQMFKFQPNQSVGLQVEGAGDPPRGRAKQLNGQASFWSWDDYNKNTIVIMDQASNDVAGTIQVDTGLSWDAVIHPNGSKKGMKIIADDSDNLNFGRFYVDKNGNICTDYEKQICFIRDNDTGSQYVARKGKNGMVMVRFTVNGNTYREVPLAEFIAIVGSGGKLEP